MSASPAATDPASGNPPSRATIPIRSPSVGARSPLPSTLPRRDRFPLGYVAADEEVLVSAKPSLWAFLDPPALLAGAISVLALAAVALDGAPESSWVLASIFVAGFLVAMTLWSRVVGRGVLVLVPLSFFLSLFVVVAVELAEPGSSSYILASVPAESVLFALLELVVPVTLALLTWRATNYAVTARRAIELSGLGHPSARELPLEQVRKVVPAPAIWGSWVGYGTVNLWTPAPVGGTHWGLGHRAIRRRSLGLSFYGVRDAPALATQIQGAIAGVVRAPGSAPATPAAPAPGIGGAGALCATCRTPLVFVAPSQRYYCPKCRTYA